MGGLLQKQIQLGRVKRKRATSPVQDWASCVFSKVKDKQPSEGASFLLQQARI